MQEEGIFIVCSGLVRVRYDVWQGTSQNYFLGTGGMFGLFSALTGAFHDMSGQPSTFQLEVPNSNQSKSDNQSAGPTFSAPAAYQPLLHPHRCVTGLVCVLKTIETITSRVWQGTS